MSTPRRLLVAEVGLALSSSSKGFKGKQLLLSNDSTILYCYTSSSSYEMILKEYRVINEKEEKGDRGLG